MLRITAFALLLLCAASACAADIRLWHSMNGVRGAEFERLVARFNASQAKFRVVATYKGAHDEAAVEAVTARRTTRAPHIVQASELGGTFLLEQKDAARSLWQVMAEGGVALRIESAFGSSEELLDADGRWLALPLGRSTPVLYYNRDAFRIAMLDPAKPPATWYDMVPTLAALLASGSECGLTLAGPASVFLENMAAWHNQAFATDRLMFNTRLAVRWVSTLASWQKSGYFTHTPEAEARFAAGECALLAASSANYADLRSRVKFELGIAPFPYYDDFDGAPLNTLGAGPALWVMAGRPQADYAGVARFLAFFARPEVQAEWHQKTGLVPLSAAAYELTRKQGFYAKHPGHEVAVRQLLVRGTPNWKSLRLGQFPRLRSIIDQELESAWQGRKTPIDALNAAVARGNAFLERNK
jgi:sn-glycerol 3-phosphate transport system substrate-binding protein